MVDRGTIAEKLTSLIERLEKLFSQFESTKDGASGTQITTNIVHHFVHEGKTFNTSVIDVENSEVSISFKTPQDLEIHMLVSINTENKSHLEILENVTIEPNTGERIKIRCRNRISNKDSGLLHNYTGNWKANNRVLKDATVSGGRLIFIDYVFASDFVGLQRRDEHEFILQKDQEYCIKLICDAKKDIGIQIHLDWYELENLND